MALVAALAIVSSVGVLSLGVVTPNSFRSSTATLSPQAPPKTCRGSACKVGSRVPALGFWAGGSGGGTGGGTGGPNSAPAIPWPSPRLGILSTPSPTPTNGNVYVIPFDIPHSCSSDASTRIAQWLATVPDNATARFLLGGCYLLNGSVAVANRTGLVIDGNGSTFKRIVPVPGARIWRFDFGSNLTIKNMKIVGTDPNHVYNATNATEHAIGVYGVQGFVASGITATQVWGDCLIATHGDSPQTLPTNVTFQYSTCDSGRQGVSVIVGSGFTFRGNTFLGSAFDDINVEPDVSTQAVSNLVIDANTLDHPAWMVGAELSIEGCHTTNVQITNNKDRNVPNASAPVWIYAKPGCTSSGVTLSGNTWLLNSANGHLAPVESRNWTYVTVQSDTFVANRQYGFGYILDLRNSQHVWYTSNIITGPYAPIWKKVLADQYSSDVHIS